MIVIRKSLLIFFFVDYLSKEEKDKDSGEKDNEENKKEKTNKVFPISQQQQQQQQLQKVEKVIFLREKTSIPIDEMTQRCLLFTSNQMEMVYSVYFRQGYQILEFRSRFLFHNFSHTPFLLRCRSFNSITHHIVLPGFSDFLFSLFLFYLTLFDLSYR